MIYVALLRGINVGGNRKVDMKLLKKYFEDAGMTAVSTYINSGNVIFQHNSTDKSALSKQLEKAIESQFGFEVKVLLRTLEDIQNIAQHLPANWTNDGIMKCDVMFLWESIDAPDIMNKIQIKPDIEAAIYVPGAVLWSVPRELVTKSGMLKLVGTDLYKQMTIRNCNTVRKLLALMQAVKASNV